MASGENKWEVVGNVKVKSKNEKQALKDKMLKIEDLPRSKTQSMMFEGANGKPPIISTTQPTTTAVKSVKPAKKRPKKAVESKYKYKTLKEGLNGEEVLNLESYYLNLKESFPDNQLLWRKEVSSYLNLHLACPEDSLSVTGKSKDFPISEAKKSTRSLLLNIFGDLKEGMVPLMFNHCVNCMLDCASKDMSVWGYRISIQALTFSNPNLCSQNIESFVDKINAMHNVPKRCLLLMWALGQSGVKDLKCGFKVWLTVMLPTLHIKNIASYSMSYIESIFEQLGGNAVKLLSGIMDVGEFHEITKLSFNEKLTSTMKTISQRMKELYPTFEKLQMSKNANKRILFEKLMTTDWEKNKIFEDKMRELCFDCLTTDQHCFNIWRSLYSDNLKNSRILLSFIETNWDNIKLPRNSFKDTIRSFCGVNKEAAMKSSHLTSNPEFSKVKALCESIDERLSDALNTPSRKASIFVQILILSAAILVAFILYDVKVHDNAWVKSDTYVFLDKNGIVKSFWDVAERAQHAYSVSAKWFQVNGKKAWKTSLKFSKPYLKQLNSWLKQSSTWLLKTLNPVFQSVLDKWDNMVFPFLKELFVQTLEFIDRIIQIIIPVFTSCVERLYIMYEWVLKAFVGKITWGELFNETVSFVKVVYYNASVQIQIWFKNIAEYVAPVNP